MQVANASAVVVGGGSGIGRGSALGLAAAGARVAVADVDPVTAEAVCAEIAAAGGTAIWSTVDGTDRESLAALAARATGAFGGVDILSSNVGVVADVPLDRATEQEWAWFLELNVLSHVRAVDVFLPHLRAGGGPAHIVLTASMAALVVPAGVGDVHLGLYNATKHAVLGYAETLRGELAGEGIGVSVLCPGMVRSNLSATSARHRPARHGGPMEALAGAAPPGVMEPEGVGPFVVRGIEGNRLYILTHHEAVPLVQQRHTALVEDFTYFAGG
jgi:NAD(P)-dependent dehydrogenase (short-subunit alcohol dehydrogenase family)